LVKNRRRLSTIAIEISRWQRRRLSNTEFLGTVRGEIFVGLISPEGELQGCAAFGYSPQGSIRERIGGPALCIERGACVHWAPPNSASFVISRACKLVYRMTGIARFFGYADPAAGEYGGVYQAAGRAYLGQGLNGKSGERRQRLCVRRPRRRGGKLGSGRRNSNMPSMSVPMASGGTGRCAHCRTPRRDRG
jgi:hypothetical protein